MIPKISVIIPMYNCQKYIDDCVDSVLKQTLSPIEVILVDDASTDDTLSYVRAKYGHKDNVKIITHEKNRGSGAARNTGVDNATGEYISFVDADDFLLNEDSLAVIYDKIKKKDAELLTSTTMQLFSNEKQPEDKLVYTKEPVTEDSVFAPTKAYALNLIAYEKVAAFPTVKLFRREFMQKNSIKSLETFFYEDAYVSWQAIMLAKKIVVTPYTFYGYRMSNNSTVRQDNPEKVAKLLASLAQVQKAVDELQEKYELNTDELAPYISRIRHNIFNDAMKLSLFAVNFPLKSEDAAAIINTLNEVPEEKQPTWLESKLFLTLCQAYADLRNVTAERDWLKNENKTLMEDKVIIV